MKKSTKIAIASLTGAAIVATGAIIAFNIINNNAPFRLDDEYYAASEYIDINKDEYEQLISNKKTFIVMIDKPGCITTPAMRENMANFPDDMQFKYYRIIWDDVKESSLHEYVKFTPSVAIIRKGEVKAWLQADRDEDTKYFNDGEALKEWIKKYILF